MMLVCGSLLTVLCYTRYGAGVWHSIDCAGLHLICCWCVALYRLCCATLDMMLVCDTLQTVLYYTRYDAGVWHSPDCVVLH